MIDSTPQSIFVLDTQARTLYANQVALDYTGLSLGDLAAGDLRRRIPPSRRGGSRPGSTDRGAV